MAISADCIAQWNMNDNAANNTVTDASSNSHNGSLYHKTTGATNTSVVSISGKVNEAFELDDTYYFLVTDHSDFSFGDGSNDSPFSIASWVYLTDDGNIQHIAAKGQASPINMEYRFYMGYQGELGFFIYGADESNYQQLLASAEVPEDEWAFVVVTYDGRGGTSATDGMNLYVNASNVGGNASSGGTYVAMSNTANNLGVGADAAGSFIIQKYIDVTSFYSKELSQAEINTLYNGGNGRESGLSLSFPLPTNNPD